MSSVIKSVKYNLIFILRTIVREVYCCRYFLNVNFKRVAMVRSRDVKHALKQEKKILDAATKCFISKGLHQTSMRDIAGEAKMSLGGMYRYFKSKNDIILKFVKQSNAEIVEAIEYLSNAKNYKKALLNVMHEIWKDIIEGQEIGLYLEVMSEAIRNEKVGKIIKKENSEKLLAKSIKDAAETGKVNLKLSPAMTALTIMSSLESAGYYHALDSRYTEKETLKHIKKLIEILL